VNTVSRVVKIMNRVEELMNRVASAVRRKLSPRFVASAFRRKILIGGGAALAAALLWLRCGPLPAGLLDSLVAESTVVVDRRGVPLYEALSGDGTRALQLSAETIPAVVAAATVAAEDHRFWNHVGVDPIAIGRAVRRNLAERGIVEGGSTISQQVAKLLLLRRAPDRHRGWNAKISEAIIALRLEHRLSKQEILALYLNLAAYGNQITGLERASRVYFGVESRMLTTAQAAFLAGLPQRPSGFNPYRHEALATSRQRVVLRRMLASGALTATELEQARQERLNLAHDRRPFLAPHFVEMVLAEARAPRAARIETTLDAALQEDIAGIIKSHRAALQRHGAANVAVVVLDNARGEWLAWEGSGDYLDVERGGSINGPRALRQPGSTLKPFTYALAFEQGFTPATVLPDVPMHFPTAEEGIVYSPRNYDGRYRGPLLARAALAGSENVPAVSLASELGIPALLRFLRRAGFSTFEQNAAHYGLGLTLGNAEVRLDELVAGYAALARGGVRLSPTYIPRHSPAADSRPLVSPRTAFWITDVLSDDAARAYIFGRGNSLEFPFPVAVKTGTSQAYHDNWTVGYTRRVTVGVWVGNFDRRPLRNSSGVTGAAPIFQAVLLAAHKRSGEIDEPLASPDPSLRDREICALSGEDANSWCPVRRREWLPADREKVPCSWHHLTDEGLQVVWPAQYREWARRNGAGEDVRSRPDGMIVKHAVHRSAVETPRERRALELVNPPAGATYLIDPTLRRDFQTLPLRVVAARPTTIEWSVNGVPIGTASSESALEWSLVPGRHRMSARDTAGSIAESVITVR
jgi:penicillin-binding protein 1C